MLMLNAIEVCIQNVENHLRYRLSIEGSKPFEHILAGKLAYKNLATTTRLPDTFMRASKPKASALESSSGSANSPKKAPEKVPPKALPKSRLPRRHSLPEALNQQKKIGSEEDEADSVDESLLHRMQELSVSGEKSLHESQGVPPAIRMEEDEDGGHEELKKSDALLEEDGVDEVDLALEREKIIAASSSNEEVKDAGEERAVALALAKSHDNSELGVQGGKKGGKKGEQSLTWLSIPNELNIESQGKFVDLLALKHRSVDETVLSIGHEMWGNKWGQFLHTPYKSFASIMENSFKDKGLTDIKMYILARFVRQMKMMNAIGQRVLNDRDAFREKNGDPAFFELNLKPVDVWLKEMFELAQQEAIDLLSKARREHETEIGLGIKREARESDSEDAVKASLHCITKLYADLTKWNKKIKKYTLPDLSPNAIASHDALLLALISRMNYAAENFYTEGLAHAQAERGCYFTSYSADSSDKREHWDTTLVKLQSKLSELKIENDGYFAKALEVIDKRGKDSKHLDSMTSMLPYFGRVQRLPGTYNELHGKLVSIAEQEQRRDVARSHRNCKL